MDDIVISLLERVLESAPIRLKTGRATSRNAQIEREYIMMYKAGLVAVIVANGKIVREMNSAGTSTVYLPFGCEYSIRFKNNEIRRAVVSVEIDGQDALSGNQLVVDANSESEIKGFLDAGGNVAKNAFRFIEKTQEISNHRGDKINDGIVRIEFQFEEPAPVMPYNPPRLKKAWPDRQPPIWCDSGILRSDNASMGSATFCSTKGFACKVNNIQSTNEAGITVAGSHVNQKFGTTYTGRLDPTKHVIVFELKGAKSDGQPIIQPVLTRKKVQCPTCGRHAKSSARFCSNCSTCLV